MKSSEEVGMLWGLYFLVLGILLSWLWGYPLPGEATSQPLSASQLEQMRYSMVETQMRARGIRDEAVLTAMSKVPRHRFVDPEYAHLAYYDCPLPIGYSQTISQPYIVAYMTEVAQISPEDRVLEIGTGCGYQTAVLAELAQDVYTVEIVAPLAHKSRQVLQELGYTNVHYKIGDGYEGWEKYAPYDVILVTAAPESIPESLLSQLGMNGRMIIPVGKQLQQIVVLRKTAQGIKQQKTLPVRFVPMVKSLAIH